MALLTTRLAERGGPHQGVARIGPPIWMGVMGVRDLKISLQARCKILDRIEITACEKPTG
jgi:hypothetical protein